MLPIIYSMSREMTQMQSQWSAQLNPILGNPLLKGNFIKDIQLVMGVNSINHRLSRPYQGYVITNMKDAYAEIYSIASTTPALTINLNASGPTTIDLLVF